MASSPDKDDGGVADQTGASPPAQPIPTASSSQHPTLFSSLPLSPLHDQWWQPQLHMDFNLPELSSNRAIDASLSDIIRFISVVPPQAAPAAPFAQPAIPPPPEMQPPMQAWHFNHGPPAMTMGTMQRSQYNGYLGAAPVHDAAAHYAVLPDEPLPPAGPAIGWRRGRPPGSTAKSKPKRNKTAVTDACLVTAATSSVEWPTSEQPAGTAFATIARNACAIEELGKEEASDAGCDGVEQEVVEYADTSAPGIRFVPSDAEIIGYLRRKYLGRRMPVDFIKEFNVFKYHPSVMIEKLGDSINGSWYVFSPRQRKYPNGSRPTRSVGNVGYWKSNGLEASVVVNSIEIGKVNSLTFMLGHQPKGDKTTWKLTEYRIQEYQLDPPSKLLDPWVICKLSNTDTEDLQEDPTDDETGEHVDAANGSGGEDNADGNQPPNDPEDELDVDEYLAVDHFVPGDPADQ